MELKKIPKDGGVQQGPALLQGQLTAWVDTQRNTQGKSLLKTFQLEQHQNLL